ncbi:hypothetical protein NIES4101_53540 [Calothrix sp. NIES-4101]|nr:hypothetical protein NIES4101_53540 [Calothrix sp. NIES-4101]
MQYAKSLRYGIFVDAETSNYLQYSQWRLVCPCCNEPVFLVKGSHRPEHARVAPKSKQLVIVREAKVKAFFSHFDNLASEKCENYNKSITEKQIKTYATTSRQQRLKYWQENFLKAIGYYNAGCKSSFFTLFRRTNQHLPDINNKGIKAVQKEVASDLIELLNKADRASILEVARSHLVKLQTHENPLSLMDLGDITDTTEELKDNFLDWTRSFDIEMQLSLVAEVVDFFKTKAIAQIKEEIFELIFARVAVTIGPEKMTPLLKVSTGESEQEQQQKYYQLRSLLVGELVFLIAITDWSS